MNATHLHLALNHFPVVLMFFGCLLALPAIFLNNPFWKRAACLVLLAAGIFAIPAFLTGEGAEHYMERLGVAKQAIKAHERTAKLAFGTALVTGGVSALVLFIIAAGSRMLRPAFIFLAVCAALTSGMLFYSSFEGGKITHKEIRESAPAANNAPAPVKRDHDD